MIPPTLRWQQIAAAVTLTGGMLAGIFYVGTTEHRSHKEDIGDRTIEVQEHYNDYINLKRCNVKFDDTLAGEVKTLIDYDCEKSLDGLVMHGVKTRIIFDELSPYMQHKFEKRKQEYESVLKKVLYLGSQSK